MNPFNINLFCTYSVPLFLFKVVLLLRIKKKNYG
mgnify:FL=1